MTPNSTTSPYHHKLLILSLIATTCILAALGLLVLFHVQHQKPTTAITAIDITGNAPNVTLDQLHVELSYTFHLEVLLKNPTIFTFKHNQGLAVIKYNEVGVGNAELVGGKVPVKGQENVGVEVTIDFDKAKPLWKKIADDILDGEIAVDADVNIPGRLVFLWIFKFKHVAKGRCQIVLGIPDREVNRTDCNVH